MIANDNRIFKRLADIRQDRDLNQYQVAHFLGVNQATYVFYAILSVRSAKMK